MVVTGTVYHTEGVIYPVQNIIMHEKYDNDSHVYDLALLKTTMDIKFDEFTKPIALASGSDQYADSKAVASGWGVTLQGGYSENLQFLELTVLSNEACKRMLPVAASSNILENNLCTLSPSGPGTCTGDSGGPLVAHNQLMGIVSWGYLCGSPRPDVFARVSEFRDWINEKMDKF